MFPDRVLHSTKVDRVEYENEKQVLEKMKNDGKPYPPTGKDGGDSENKGQKITPAMRRWKKY